MSGEIEPGMVIKLERDCERCGLSMFLFVEHWCSNCHLHPDQAKSRWCCPVCDPDPLA
jgi:ribosomal protein L37E